MTKAEAIRILDPETTGEALEEIEYYNGFSGKTAAMQAVSDACVLAVSALREQEERRWISVTERLPEENGQYLVVACDEGCTYGEGIWYDTVVVVADYWNKGCWSWYDGSIEYDLTGIVTHWMPLPEPPKEGLK